MAPKKADLLAQARELGYDVDDSLTRKELAELVARGPAAPEGEEAQIEAPTAESPADESPADESPDAGEEPDADEDTDADEEPDADEDTDADEEPDAPEPTLTSGGVDEQRRAMRYPTAVRMGRPRL